METTIHMTSPQILTQMLRCFVDDTQEMLGQLAVVQEYMENEPGFSYPALVAEWGYHYYEAEVKMAQKKLLDRIDGSEDTLPSA